MPMNIAPLLNRLESLSMRERILTLAGIPLALVAAGEVLVFGPGRNEAAEAAKRIEQIQTEIKALEGVLATQPAAAPLPAADQLRKQRAEMLAKIDAAGALVAELDQSVNWGTVVRATVAGTPGLTLTQLKTVPAEVVFAPSSARIEASATPGNKATPAKGAASTPRASADAQATAAPIAAMPTIYRHRAELSVQGDFGALMGYLQTLQRVPGDLHWERLQLGVAAYPQASVQLTLHTLSTRADTPFN
jgi:MSHA biogenesis protein MshJ